MDGGRVEVDDLFGDAATLGESVALNLPIHSLQAKGLAQHMDDLHRSSTEQKKIAWSRWGCIAAISPSDPSSVGISYLLFSKKDGKWSLSTEQPLELGAREENNHPILQLQWSQSGAELAIADAAGRIAIVNASSMALTEMNVVRPPTMDREDDFNQVLAMYWLNVDRHYPTFMQASKDQGRWTYMAAKRRPMGPFWPRGLFVVTRRGTLIFHYQRPDARWATARADLRSLTPNCFLLTHAAIAPTQDNKLLIATQSAHRQLLVYVVTLDLPDIRQDPHMMSGPRISIENVRASLPYKSAKDSTVQSDGSVLFDTSSHFLSHLEIVPTSDVEKSLQLPPTVVAFYTPVINAMGMANDGQLGRTTIRRWHVVSAEHKLHPSFDGIIQKWKAPTLGRRTDLQRLDDVHTNHIVTTVQKVDGGEHLVLGCADGSLTVYDPSSVTPLYMSTDPAEVTGMAQAEFVFPSSSRGLDVSVSPNACVAASLGNDGKVQLTHLEHPTGLPYDSTDPGTVEAPLAAIILSFARAFYAQISWNDIMLLVTQHLSPTHYPHLIESSLKALFPDRDLVLGPELGSPPKPIIARVLSLAASLGYDPSSRQRTLPSMLSWLTLNIRARALTFMSIWSSLNPNGGAEWKDPEVCEIACNNIKWTLDLCKFIVDDLFEMADRLSATPDGNSSYQPPDSDSTSITKLLLVSIWPRSFLKMIVRILRGFVRATQDPKTTLSREAAPSFSRMAELIESSPLKMEPLEQLLSGVDKMVQKFYEVNGMSERERSDTERYVMAHGEIPQVLHDVVPRILQDVLPLTRSKMDRLGLYMEDHSWLGIREDSKTKAFKRDFVVDVHRKKIMRRKGLGKVRKCVRCGSISADLVRMKHWPQYLHNQMLRCVCEDVFAVVGPEEV